MHAKVSERNFEMFYHGIIVAKFADDFVVLHKMQENTREKKDKLIVIIIYHVYYISYLKKNKMTSLFLLNDIKNIFR